MANPFSPNYIEPKKISAYLKLNDGANLIRILTPKLQILTYFTEFVNGTNIDDKTGQLCKIKKTYKDEGNGKFPLNAGLEVKKVWACIIYNQDLKKVQIAEFSQKSIQKFLFSIASGKIKNDWSKFDIQISKSGERLETKYTFVAGDTEEFTAEMLASIKPEIDNIDLQSLEVGEEPFLDQRKK